MYLFVSLVFFILFYVVKMANPGFSISWLVLSLVFIGYFLYVIRRYKRDNHIAMMRSRSWTTLILFIVFYLINIKAWRFIYGKVYLLDGLDEECNHYKKIESNKKEIFYKPVQKRKKRKKRGKTTLSKLLLPLHYTAITFFSLSIKFNKIKYEENISGWRGILGLFFVLVIHFTGLVCIAFMVNYALSDGVKFLSPF